MPDIVTPEKRSLMMSGIRGKNTKPEITIRKGLHSMGFRFRIHYRKLPGKPDIVLPKYRAVIFINGCFWHGHNCHLFKLPSTRSEFWLEKIQTNKGNDAKCSNAILSMNWRILYVWECSLKGKTRIDDNVLLEKINKWLVSEEKFSEIAGVTKVALQIDNSGKP